MFTENAMSTREIAAVARRRPSNGRFIRHFFEMLGAMVVGMAVFGGIVSGVFALLGHSNLLHYAALRALLMATYMTAGMSVWMGYRGHDWPRIREMAAAMFAPFILLLIPFWAGLVSSGGLLAGGHLLMLPFMLGVMFLNREEYSQDHRQHSKSSATIQIARQGTNT